MVAPGRNLNKGRVPEERASRLNRLPTTDGGGMIGVSHLTARRVQQQTLAGFGVLDLQEAYGRQLLFTPGSVTRARRSGRGDGRRA